ncbi:MAG: sulfatase [Thaumarchaeota archaeon]|nr:sulfatase [Nitrososphaerota archaeon]
MEKPNIILIVCDTLRKDILEIYGGPAKTPNLKKLAKDAMVYHNCIAPSPWTIPSHASIFTGLYPSSHMIHETKESKSFMLAESVKNFKGEQLQYYLKNLGYTTMCFSNNIMISRLTNFDLGFDFFTNIEVNLPIAKEIKSALNLGANINQIGISLIKQGRYKEILKYAKIYLEYKNMTKAIDYPFKKGGEITSNLLFNTKFKPKLFLVINFMELHEPYLNNSGKEKKYIFDALTGINGINKGTVSKLKKHYILETQYLDEIIGQLIEMLKSRGLYENSMIIITSDHGQAFNEYNYMYHGIYLHDEIIKVPLIIKYPNNKKFKLKNGYQSLINIFPLIKEVLSEKDDRVLTTKSAISESFANDKFLPESYKHRQSFVDKKYEKLRRAIYKNNFKLVFNYTDNKIEEITKSGKPINTQQNKFEIKSLLRYLKQMHKG